MGDVNVKLEPNVKEEPDDTIEVEIESTPAGIGSSTEENDYIKSESETDDEVYYDNELDNVKEEEVKREEAKKVKNSTAASRFDGFKASDGGKNNPIAGSEGKVRKGTSREQNKRSIPRNQAAKKEKKHKCSHCQYKTAYTAHLTVHMRTHTRVKPFQCDVCLMKFSVKNSLNRHMKVHAPKFQFRCSKCRRGFSQKSGFIDHEKKCQHPQYECYLCKYCTINKHNLKQHMHNHNRVKSFECSICHRSYTRKENLNKHLKIHGDELQYECSQCGDRFFKEKAKDSHEQCCRKRRYECHLCRYKCFAKFNLNDHMKAKHTGDKPFRCGSCDKKFRRKFYLNIHLGTHHDRSSH